MRSDMRAALAACVLCRYPAAIVSVFLPTTADAAQRVRGLMSGARTPCVFHALCASCAARPMADITSAIEARLFAEADARLPAAVALEPIGGVH